MCHNLLLIYLPDKLAKGGPVQNNLNEQNLRLHLPCRGGCSYSRHFCCVGQLIE